MKISYMVIFFIFAFSSNHLHPLQVENCDSDSRLVVDEDDNVKSGLKGLNKAIWNLHNLCTAKFCPTQICCKLKSAFVENSKNRRPVTLYVKPRLLSVTNLNI